jgi:hypothetical protein
VGRNGRTDTPLIFSTELVAHFAYDPDAAAADADVPVDPTDPAMIPQARRHFKKRLNGIINIRSDGNHIYAYRRIPTDDQFVKYGPINRAARTPD